MSVCVCARARTFTHVHAHVRSQDDPKAPLIGAGSLVEGTRDTGACSLG